MESQRWISPNMDQNVHLRAFGGGARACLGKNMAMLRSKLTDIVMKNV
jgi:cytochrome P450